MPGWRGLARVGLSAAVSVVVAMVAAACSLGNVPHDACESDAECTAVFGFGSACTDGYCSESPACAKSDECREQFGYGVECAAGRCATVPAFAGCELVRKAEGEASAADALGGPLHGLNVGMMFDLSVPKQAARASAVEAAFTAIADNAEIKSVGLVRCNLEGRAPKDVADYLGRRLGLPLILGPATSSGSLDATSSLYSANPEPVVIISPSASGIQLSAATDKTFDPKRAGLFWRMCANDKIQAAALAGYIASAGAAAPKKLAGFRRVGDAYGESYKSTLADEFARLDAGTELFDQLYATGDAPGDKLEAAIASVETETGIDGLVVFESDGATARAVIDAIAKSAKLAALPVYLTDGAKDAVAFLKNGAASPAERAVLESSRGIGPAVQRTDFLPTALKASAKQFAYIGHSWDAAFFGLLGVARARQLTGSTSFPRFDGLDVADGLALMSNTESAPAFTLTPANFNLAAGALQGAGASIDIEGASGPLDFNGDGEITQAVFEVFYPAPDLKTFVVEEPPDAPTP